MMEEQLHKAQSSKISSKAAQPFQGLSTNILNTYTHFISNICLVVTEY